MTPDERRQAWYRLNAAREGRRASVAAHQCYEGNPVGDVEAGNAYVRARLAAHFGRLALGHVEVLRDHQEIVFGFKPIMHTITTWDDETP